MLNESMFSSKKQDWETPKDFFDELDKEFNFEFDVCANEKNSKLPFFFTPEDNALTKPWFGRCWMNPPYGREIKDWVKKAYEESRKPGTMVVALLPARTDTKWFHEYIYGKAEIRFIKGRLKFVGAEHFAPFPSMIVIWK
jgi:phage N-6-adenine-methyltransferase